MKWPRLHLSAQQTAAVSMAGALVASCGFLAAYWLSDARRAHRHLGWSLAAMACLVIPGYTLSILAQADLKNGIAAERWPQQEIDSLRNLLTSRWTTAFSLLCTLMFALLAVFGLFSSLPHSAYSSIGWAFYAPGTTAMWLRSAIAPPSSHTPSPPRLIATSPLQSDHWGQR